MHIFVMFILLLINVPFLPNPDNLLSVGFISGLILTSLLEEIIREGD